MEDIIIPLSVAVLLPIAIVLIVFMASINSDNKRAKVLIKAIECNPNIDTERLAEAFKKPRKTPRELFNIRLLRGCIFSLAGLFLTVMGLMQLDAFKTIEDNMDLMLGAISLAVGLAYLVVAWASRRHLNDE